MRYAFIKAEKARYPVRVLCRCLEVSAAGYYEWLGAEPSRREQEDERLGVEVAAIFRESRRRYGSPRVHEELRDRTAWGPIGAGRGSPHPPVEPRRAARSPERASV